ncbi:MAG: HupE/UreJ family protein [Sphingobacteriaceae bacterium]
MQDFALYFELGWQHILDWRGYDHMLFVAAMCASYVLADWRKVLGMVTAFTIGHSLTLALSVVNLVFISPKWIELLIPITIVSTCLVNLTKPTNTTRLSTYFITLIFGLIHGLGFSAYLKSLLGQDDSILGQLFAFNLGLEAGQLIVVGVFLLLAQLVLKSLQISRRDWILFLSSAIFGIALLLTLERLPIHTS